MIIFAALQIRALEGKKMMKDEFCVAHNCIFCQRDYISGSL